MRDSIIQQFDEAAGRAGGATALIWRGARWSYWDLRAAIAEASAGLRGRAPARGARVALLVRNSPQYVALFYGALAAGLVAVPLNAQERASVLARQIEHCSASVLIGVTDHP